MITSQYRLTERHQKKTSARFFTCLHKQRATGDLQLRYARLATNSISSIRCGFVVYNMFYSIIRQLHNNRKSTANLQQVVWRESMWNRRPYSLSPPTKGSCTVRYGTLSSGMQGSFLSYFQENVCRHNSFWSRFQLPYTPWAIKTCHLTFVHIFGFFTKYWTISKIILPRVHALCGQFGTNWLLNIHHTLTASLHYLVKYKCKKNEQ